MRTHTNFNGDASKNMVRADHLTNRVLKNFW
jgi:hypothetical protein